MSIALLDRIPAPPVVEEGLGSLVSEAGECLARAGLTPVESVDSDALGETVSKLARVESRAAALRLALSAEADRRRVADQTAETGTDAWLARYSSGPTITATGT